MKLRGNVSAVVLIGTTLIFFSCNKKSSSEKPAPVANQEVTQPNAEPPAEEAPVSETKETTSTTKQPETAAGTAGQAQQQLGIALQEVNYNQYAIQPVSFIAQTGTVAVQLGRESGLSTPQSLRSLRAATAVKDIDIAERKFSWEPAQDPIKSSEKIRCLVEKSEYIAALAKAMKERPKFPPNKSDEAKGVYTFDVTYRWTTNVKQKDLKTSCLTEGSSFGGENQGGGNSSDNKLAKFTGEIVTAVVAKQTGVDSGGTPEFDAVVEPLTVKVWITLDDSLMGMGQAATSPGGMDSGSASQRNYYVTLKVDEAPSLKNPNGKTEFSWTAYKVVDGGETDEVVAGRRVSSADTAGSPTLSFRERLTHSETWGTGTSATGYRMTTEQKAFVRYKPAAVGATHGRPYDQTIARTATSYNWEPIPSSSSYTPGQDQSGSFSYVWDASSNRSLTKWIPTPGAPQWWGGLGMEAFDPTLPVCRDTEHLQANIYNYGLFSPAGKRLYHKTYFTIETDKVDSWGWPIMGGIGTWGMWMYGVDNGETVFIRNDAGDRVAYTYKLLPGSLRDQNYNEVAPSTDLELVCSNNCPLSNITDASAAYRADGPVYRYRYVAAQRKLVFDPNPAVASDEEDITLDNSVDNAWLSFNLALLADSSVSYTWQVNRSRWTNAQLTENGMWFDYYNLNGTKTDTAGTYTPPSDVSFTCTTGCLKSGISAADLAANPKTVTLADAGAGTPYCYIYRVASNDYNENYKLYRDTTCDGFDVADVAVGYGSDVTKGLVSMSMKLAGSSPVRTIEFKLEKQEYGASAGLEKSNGTWFTAPSDIKFQPLVYNSSLHAYPGMTHPSVDGVSTAATGPNSISQSGELSFSNGYLCCIQWAETDIANAWGGKDWAPVATFRKGVPFTVANTTGNFTAGAEVLIAPTQTQLTSPPVSDCSNNLKTQVNGLEASMALPDETNLPFTNERERNGAAPTVNGEGHPIPSLQI